MLEFEQLNIYSVANPNSPSPQQVHLFTIEELEAELFILPPGGTTEWHSHANKDEILDVLEGQGVFEIEEKQIRGGSGKSVMVHAGVRHRLHNDSTAPWLVRSTSHQRLTARDIGKLIARAVRQRLGMV